MLELVKNRVVLNSSEGEAFLAELNRRSPLIQQGFNYWQSKGWPESMPSRADIDPFKISKLLPNVLLIDVLRDPLDFRYRVIGTGVVENSNGDRTGRKLSETEGKGPDSRIWKALADVAESGMPMMSDLPYEGPHARFRYNQDIILPLAGEGGDVAMLLVFVDFLSKRAA